MTFFQMLYKLILGPLELLFDVIYAWAMQLIHNPGLAIIFLSLCSYRQCKGHHCY